MKENYQQDQGNTEKNIIKKICFFIGNFNHGAGTERCTQLIGEGLAKRGFDVSIVSECYGLEPFFAVSSDIHLYSLHLENCNKKNKLQKHLKVSHAVRMFFQTHSFDIVVAVDVFLYFYLHLACKRFKFQVIAWEHFAYDCHKTAMEKLARRWAVKYAKKIIVLSKSDLQNYHAHFPRAKNILCLYDPVAYQISRETDMRNQKVIAAGRLVKQKGFDLLIDIWDIVEKECSGWELEIYGDGVLHEELQAQINKLKLHHVRLMGNTNELDKKMKGASIFALSSRYEGFGLVLLEAQANGLPCISFDCKEGPKEIIDDGVNGFLIPLYDKECYAQKLIQLMKDLALRERFSAASRKDLYRFDIDNVVEQWVELIKTL